MTTFSVGGVAQPFEATFIIEAQLNKVRPEAEPRLRELLKKLDETEQNIFDATGNVEAEAVGSIKVNLNVLRDMELFYLRWRAQLCNMIQCFPNPYDKRYGGGGGINSIAVG